MNEGDLLERVHIIDACTPSASVIAALAPPSCPRMRLLFVASDPPAGPPGSFGPSLELALRLARRVDSLIWLGPEHPGSDRVDEALGARAIRIPQGRGLKLRLARRQLQLMPSVDAAFHTSWPSSVVPALSSSLHGKPLLVSFQGRELWRRPTKGLGKNRTLYDAARKVVLERTTHLLPTSRATAGLLTELGAPAERITVLPRGVDRGRFTAQNGAPLRAALGLFDDPVLLTLGPLISREGFEQLLWALRGILREVPRVQLVILGECPARAEVEHREAELALADHVHQVGSVSEGELPEWYSMADLFLMPGRSEAAEMGDQVYLEAMACGTPVIAPDEGGASEVVVDGETGMLVDPRSGAPLARAVLNLLEDPELADVLTRNARRRIEEELSWDRIAERVLALL